MPSRTSLDSRFSRITSSSGQKLGDRPTPESMEEDNFEDVGLNDDDDAKPKKKGIFSRFGDFSNDAGGTKQSSHLGFHLPGRKKATQVPPSSEMRPMKNAVASEVSEVREA